jgi:hypothetical protein
MEFKRQTATRSFTALERSLPSPTAICHVQETELRTVELETGSRFFRSKFNNFSVKFG